MNTDKSTTFYGLEALDFAKEHPCVVEVLEDGTWRSMTWGDAYEHYWDMADGGVPFDVVRVRLLEGEQCPR